MPVRLSPGRWYLGVYNFDTVNIPYRMLATASNAPLYTYTNLLDGVPTNFVVEGRTQLTNFYRFISDRTNAAILFEIFDLDEDVDMIVRRADLPSRDLYDFSFLSIGSTNAPSFVRGGYEPVPLRTNIFLPHLNATNWWIGLYSNFGDGGQGTISAKTFTNSNPMVGFAFGASASMVSNLVQLTWTSVPGTGYQPEVTTDLANWIPFSPCTNALGSITSVTDNNSGAGGLRFYRVRATICP